MIWTFRELVANLWAAWKWLMLAYFGALATNIFIRSAR